MISRRFLATLFSLALLSSHAAEAARTAYVIIDAQTGFVLEQAEARDKRQIGSLTKVATAMVVLDWSEKRGGDLNQVATIPPEAFAGTGENLIGFQPGDRVALRDLLYAALVQSDNVAAYTLASVVGTALQSVLPEAGKGGPVAVFVGQMNFLAKSLRMDRTRFSNPHGIDTDVKPMPYSTAADLARLTRYAINKPAFRFYVSKRSGRSLSSAGNKKKAYMLRNTNELLGTGGVDGVKTGKTARAGDCLILSAHREPEIQKQGERTKVTPRNLIVVLLGSANRFTEGGQLLARGWQLYDQWAAAGRMIDPKKTL